MNEEYNNGEKYPFFSKLCLRMKCKFVTSETVNSSSGPSSEPSTILNKSVVSNLTIFLYDR